MVDFRASPDVIRWSEVLCDTVLTLLVIAAAVTITISHPPFTATVKYQESNVSYVVYQEPQKCQVR